MKPFQDVLRVIECEYACAIPCCGELIEFVAAMESLSQDEQLLLRYEMCFPGCEDVVLEANTENVVANLIDDGWTVTVAAMTPEQCAAKLKHYICSKKRVMAFKVGRYLIKIVKSLSDDNAFLDEIEALEYFLDVMIEWCASDKNPTDIVKALCLLWRMIKDRWPFKQTAHPTNRATRALESWLNSSVLRSAKFRQLMNDCCSTVDLTPEKDEPDMEIQPNA